MLPDVCLEEKERYLTVASKQTTWWLLFYSASFCPLLSALPYIYLSMFIQEGRHNAAYLNGGDLIQTIGYIFELKTKGIK